VSLVDSGFSVFDSESPYYRVATCHKDVFIVDLHAFDGFLTGDERFYYFVRFEVYATDHLVPRSSEKHVVGRGDFTGTDRVCKLEDGNADTGGIVPLPYCAVIRCRYDEFCISGYDSINSISVPD
jgi:hypothetical protein